MAHLPSMSAADAIGRALELHLGHRVINCFVGGYDKDGKLNHDRFPGGRTDFEVPPHEPLARKPGRTRIPRQTRGAAELFDDAEILAESDRAKTEHDRTFAAQAAPYIVAAPTPPDAESK